jgi:hypothetical protein
MTLPLAVLRRRCEQIVQRRESEEAVAGAIGEGLVHERFASAE